MFRKMCFVLAAILLMVTAAVAAYNIFAILSEYSAGEAASEELRQYIALDSSKPAFIATGPAEPELAEPQPTEDPVAYPDVDFQSLQDINEDVIAWIYIEDTQINYPLVQGTDNSYYMSVMADGRRNAAGSIFMDYRNEPDFSDRHTVIYGHNMRNGSMFNNIRNYLDPEFYAAHPTGMIMTPDGNFQFEVIAGYVARTDAPAWRVYFDSDADFSDWLQDTMARSTIGGTIVPGPEDRIITLSTCSYEFSNARFVLICRIK